MWLNHSVQWRKNCSPQKRGETAKREKKNYIPPVAASVEFQTKQRRENLWRVKLVVWQDEPASCRPTKQARREIAFISEPEPPLGLGVGDGVEGGEYPVRDSIPLIKFWYSRLVTTNQPPPLVA